MKLRYLFGILLVFVVLSGCTGGGKEQAPTVVVETPAETTAAPATTAAPTTEAPAAQEEVALHGVGTCDTCHDAPTMADMKAGKHKIAFEKSPVHKNLCKNCHDVQEQCTKCHELPDIMK